MWRSRRKYAARVSEGLEKAYAEASVEEIPLREGRFVFLSDQHRGSGDRADDFRVCQKIYHASLGYYDSLRYRLGLLGDVEELWQRLLLVIVDRYEGTLELEARFFKDGRGIRILGNHDEALAWPWHRSLIAKYLHGAPLEESRLLRLVGEQGEAVGEILLVHGHQGTNYNWLDRFVVKWIWTPMQRLTGIKLGTPSTDHGIRKTHELSLYKWAAGRPGLLLVCGHTHHPVFMSAAWEQTVRQELESLRSEGAPAETVAMKEAELHWITAEMDELRDSLPANPKPCYFNTGCCSFHDGSITGVELDNGVIRLVRWTGESGSPERLILREAELASLFQTWRLGEQADPAEQVRAAEALVAENGDRAGTAPPDDEVDGR